MEAKVKNHGEIAIVKISGRLDIERTQPFKTACEKHFLGKKVIFNLQQANFVGSTGIHFFVETMRTLSRTSNCGLKLVGLNSEFRRIFSNMEIQGLEIHETENSAITSYLNPPPAMTAAAAPMTAPITAVVVIEDAATTTTAAIVPGTATGAIPSIAD